MPSGPASLRRAGARPVPIFEQIRVGRRRLGATGPGKDGREAVTSAATLDAGYDPAGVCDIGEGPIGVQFMKF